MNSHSKHISKSWGLFVKHAPIALPLKALNISISILHNVARVFYTQVYNNNSSSLLETEFFFPISPDACFDSFEAKFNHITIKGVIKEKTQAQEEYKQAISSGKTAAYSEINKDTGDLMKISIGNIPPNSDVAITYSYIQKMETSLGKFWCFRLFSTFTPRYNGDLNEYLNKDIAILANYPTISSSQAGSYPWNIEVEIQSPSPIKFLDSPSHKVVTKYGNENHTCTITLDPTQNYKPNKDFVLLYSNGKENQIDYVLTPFEDGYCAMVTLLADFSTKEANEVFSNLAKAKQPEECYSMDTIRGEYIFLIDRSGSMDGERINMAKSSLLLFLKSLPKDSYFNVVSFGSQHSFLHDSSQAYSQQALISTIKEVEEFSADMDGTEIYSALCKVFDSPPNKGYPRLVFLLTDGAVSNTQKVLNLIDQNSSKARVFTIGIGNGCSPELITKGASYGKGKHEFVQDTKDIHAKVISLLDASLSPSYSDLSLESDNFDAFVKRVTPNPASIPFLLNGEPITFFLMIRKEAFEENQKMSLKLKFYDTRIKKHRTIDIILDTDEAMENNLIPKLAIHDMLERFEAPTQRKKIPKKIIWTGETGMKGVLAELSSKYGVSCKDTALKRSEASTEKTENLEETIWTDKNDIKDTLVELSLKYGILCKDTAFFCEIAEGNDETKTLTPVQILILTILPQDYEPMFNTISAPRFFAGQNARQQVQKLEELKTKLAVRYSPCKKVTPSRSSAAGFFDSDDEDEDVTISSQHLNRNVRASVSSPSYLDVIMKQNFEGSWDPADQGIKQTVLTDGSLPALPKQLESKVNLDEEMWITVLVLLWLEVRFQNEKQAWRLIHQKGCEWLKSKGVSYEELKELRRSVIKT